MLQFPNTATILPALPYTVRNLVANWIKRGRVPAGVLAVITHEQLYQALKSDLSANQHTS